MYQDPIELGSVQINNKMTHTAPQTLQLMT